MQDNKVYKCKCGNDYFKVFVVKSAGPHEYWAEEVEECGECFAKSIRGDGHCYQGCFASLDEAQQHADFLSQR